MYKGLSLDASKSTVITPSLSPRHVTPIAVAVKLTGVAWSKLTSTVFVYYIKLLPKYLKK